MSSQSSGSTRVFFERTFNRLGLWLASTNAMSPSAGGAAAAVEKFSGLDMAFRRVLVFSKLFTDSWGDPRVLQELFVNRREIMGNRRGAAFVEEQCQKTDMIIDSENIREGIRTLTGKFRSPYALEFPHQMQGPVQWAHWKGLFPQKERKGLVIHLAGTGDHTYFRREAPLCVPLLKETGTAAIILQNPFYAERKPPEQFRSSLKNVSDLFVMGAALITECLYLLRWAKQEGFWPLGLSGVSMGGHMASLAGSNSVFPVGIAPCLSWTSAAPVFTEGALSCSIPFDVLGKQLEDSSYMEKIAQIPGCTWFEEARELHEKNGKSVASNFMWILMTEFTDLGNYPVPLDTSLCQSIIAQEDAYVIRRGATPLQDLWPDATVKNMPEVGHVGAYFVGHKQFRDSIYRTLQLTEAKYPYPTTFKY